MKTVGLRMVVASVLIVVLTMFWAYLVFFTDISMLALAGIALLIVLTLSTATAWTAVGIPHEQDRGERGEGKD